MGIVATMAALTVPAMNTLKGGYSVGQAASELSGLFEQARAYAMSHNTYVYVGVLEGDGTREDAAGGGTGQVLVAVGAARDGTRQDFTKADGLELISKLRAFKSVQLVDFSSPPASGSMARPTVDSAARLGSSAFTIGNPNQWKITKGGVTYTFNKVIQFDPQGTASAQNASDTIALPQRLELALQQAHGNARPAAAPNGNTGNLAVLQIDGLTGGVQLYRP